ncbi:MAG: hypothetical protein H0X66_02055 [Verrucomicrobia bacterium]|nr:hypothetical protein [Verrucomicrobiota bacterium]
MGNRLFNLFGIFFACFGFSFFADAQQFTGTNEPGSAKSFSFTIPAATTNWTLTVPGGTSAYSYLYVRKGVAASATNYNYSSQSIGRTNTIALENPEASGTWHVSVVTPEESESHSFTMVLKQNVAGFRVLQPINKPLAFSTTGIVNTGKWNYYRIEVPDRPVRVNLILTGPDPSPNLYIQKEVIPTTSSYWRRSINALTDKLSFTDTELVPGVYFIGVHSPSSKVSYTLTSKVLKMVQLPFDSGFEQEGTDFYEHPVTAAGDTYFRIRTELPSVGAWRTALKVISGEADLYISRGVLPTATLAQFKSTRVGSDGIVLGTSQFTAGQDWYILVRAAANSKWKLVSGAAFVADLGTLSETGSSGDTTKIGPEGWLFYKTGIGEGTLAWRLSLNGATNNIFVKKTSLPIGKHEAKSAKQMLLVPPYLVAGEQYFVGIPGVPGRTISLDSRAQIIQDIAFNSSSSTTSSGYSYTTYRVEVPPNIVAWQLDLTGSAKATKFYVRRSLVPNEWNNQAYCETVATNKSLALVPPILTDGTYYITAVGNGAHSFTLKSGPAQITDINFTSQTVNAAAARVGWRYFRVADIDAQLGALGWELLLSNAVPGTRIVIRRSQAPGIWDFRGGNTTSSTAVRHYDYISQATSLKRPGHQADVWYVGVYNPDIALGNFTLTSREIGAAMLTGDGGTHTRNLINGNWAYYRVDVPDDVLGWDLRLVNVTGTPKMVVCHQALPGPNISSGVVTTNVSTTLSSPSIATSWPIAKQWAANQDWTSRSLSALGTNETGRILAMGMGRPLQSGTYYVGVFNHGNTKASFTIASRFIGPGRKIPVTDLAFANGSATGGVGPRGAAYYRVTVPPLTRSWRVKLTVNTGEAMLVVSTNKVPNVESAKRMQKLGTEHYLLLPDRGSDFLKSGDHYLAVVGEGANPQPGRVGTGSSSYTIQSLGQLPERDLGPITSAGIVRTDALEGGAVKAYHFTVPGNIAGYECFLKKKIGNPVAVIRAGPELPSPGLGKSLPKDPYGNQGGEDFAPDCEVFNSHLYAAAIPGIEFTDTIMMMARSASGGYPDANYTLQIKELVPKTIAFDNGIEKMTNHPAGQWKFFRIVVPANAAGWDLRLANVTAGTPKLIVNREILPIPYRNDGFTGVRASLWGVNQRWPAGKDWTGRSLSAQGVSEDGRILAMGMGRPLVAGTYYVGVQSPTLSSYTLVSRGIGAGFTIPVRDLAFNGTFSTTATTTLPPRHAAYFRVNVPPNMQSWKLSLTPTSKSEVNLIVLKDVLPNVLAAASLEVAKTTSAGRRTKKIGAEDFLLLPSDKQSTLTPGLYYIAVVSEGMNATNATRVGTDKVGYTLTSHGSLPLTDLGTLTTSITNQGAMKGGQVVGYQFEIPPGTVSLEAVLDNKVGNPVMVLRRGPLLPDPSISVTGVAADGYGVDGGETTGTKGGANIITFANPTNGIYYLLVKARPVSGIYTNASFRLRLSVITSEPLDFDGGTTTIANQPSSSWKYFRVDVPEEALGWDLRLTNVFAGLPRMVVSKDALPGSLSTKPWSSPGNQSLWPTTNHWAAGADWTRRQFSADGTVDQNGRILAMGMGKPLMPGSYYVGIVNSVGTASMSYTLVSRGIGEGYTIPITPLPYEGGSVTNLALPPREAAYFSVEIPSNAPSFKMKLTGLFGEAMMVGLREHVPNVEYIDTTRSIQTGKTIQKAGNEHFLLLPPANENQIATGMVYFAVVGEGAVTNNTRIGSGSSAFVLNTLGALPLTALGVLAGTNEVEYMDALEGGESKGYEFVLAPEVLGVELKLENRVGNPVMVWREGELLPNPGGSFSSLPNEPYGNEGGSGVVAASQTLLTLATTTAQAGEGYSTNRLMVKARSTSGVFSDATYKLRIRPINVPELNFSASTNENGLTNAITASLENGHRAFYKVVVPEDQVGWKLELAQASGTASVRARKNQFPSDIPLTGTPFATPAAYIVAPVLTPGTWFVEVKAQSLTTYTLTSSPLELERPAWNMPASGETNTAPGVSLPFFGDTAIDTNGLSFPSTSVFLESGYQHYYAFHIPAQNVGLVRLQLEAISGNPNLYLRYAGAPTITHNMTGVNGVIYDRTVAGNLGTEYANFVPVDGKVEESMKAGLWYLAVRASGANSRYRIRFSIGNVQEIPMDGTLLTDQVVAGGDWRYYSFRMPDPVAAQWQLAFSKQLGDMAISIRDTVPPGLGASVTQRRHWGTDAKNHGPYLEFSTAGTYTFNTPPSRPGELYYVGVRGLNDATFSLSVKILDTGAVAPQMISFYSGSTETDLAPFTQRTYRIDVPNEATRLKLINTHSSLVKLHMEQGTLPLKTSADDWRSTTANSLLNQYLGGWPWKPGKAYFLVASNTTANVQTLKIQTDGKNAVTDDEDNDGMLDEWERQYFGTTTQTASADFDGDGVSNLDEYLEGTNPADNNSFNPRLTISAANGVVTKSPDTSFYAMNTTVQLTPVPTNEYLFAGWSGSHIGIENPLNLLMDTNKSLTATFKVRGDDFGMAVPLTGTSILTNGTNVNATREMFEVDHGGNPGGKSLWWSWTAPSSGTASISTEGSSFPTLLGVYIGNTLTNLLLATNDTNLSGGSYRARATLGIEGGTTYQIAVDGLNGASGSVQLAIALSPSAKPGNVSVDPVVIQSTVSEIAINLLLPEPVGERQLRFKIASDTNQVYFIEASTNLMDWESVGIVENGVTQPIQHKSSAMGKSMFYRLRAP